MKNLKPVLIAVGAFLIVLFAVSLVMKKPASNSLTESTTGTVQEENLNSDLNSLDATDLDTGTNGQLDQLDTASSSF